MNIKTLKASQSRLKMSSSYISTIPGSAAQAVNEINGVRRFNLCQSIALPTEYNRAVSDRTQFWTQTETTEHPGLCVMITSVSVSDKGEPLNITNHWIYPEPEISRLRTSDMIAGSFILASFPNDVGIV